MDRQIVALPHCESEHFCLSLKYKCIMYCSVPIILQKRKPLWSRGEDANNLFMAPALGYGYINLLILIILLCVFSSVLNNNSANMKERGIRGVQTYNRLIYISKSRKRVLLILVSCAKWRAASYNSSTTECGWIGRIVISLVSREEGQEENRRTISSGSSIWKRLNLYVHILLSGFCLFPSSISLIYSCTIYMSFIAFGILFVRTDE